MCLRTLTPQWPCKGLFYLHVILAYTTLRLSPFQALDPGRHRGIQAVKRRGRARSPVMSSIHWSHVPRLTPMEPILSFLSFTSHYLICPLHIEPSLLLKCFSSLPFLFWSHCHHPTFSPCQLMPDLIQHLPDRQPCLQGPMTPIYSAQLRG